MAKSNIIQIGFFFFLPSPIRGNPEQRRIIYDIPFFSLMSMHHHFSAEYRMKIKFWKSYTWKRTRGRKEAKSYKFQPGAEAEVDAMIFHFSSQLSCPATFFFWCCLILFPLELLFFIDSRIEKRREKLQLGNEKTWSEYKNSFCLRSYVKRWRRLVGEYMLTSSLHKRFFYVISHRYSSRLKEGKLSPPLI